MPENKSQTPINLRSEEVQEILTNPPSWIVRWGITLIFLFTCIILTLSFLIKYPEYVSANVIVTTKRPTEKLIARYSGQIDTIFIENRDTVQSGQKLVILKNTSNYEDVLLLKSILDTLNFSLSNFYFPMEKTTNLALGDVEVAYINFEKSYVDYSLLKDLEPYTYKLEGTKQSLAEVKIRLVNQVKQKQLLEKEYVLFQTDFERHKELFTKGVISQKEYETKELEFIQMQKNISAMAITISQMREAIASSNQAFKSTEVDEREESTRYLINLSQSYNALKKSVRDWEHNYTLSSSINGVVSFQQFWGINQQVNTGEVVFSILPTNDTGLIGKSIITSQNAGRVAVGQKVLIKLNNFPYQQYGMLVGIVESISISPNTDGNYFVYISLPNRMKTSYGQNLKFNQELIGNAEIITEDVSIAQKLFYKFNEVLKYN
ncbi:secretion protein HlyD [Flagellimonas aquimarina]|jgi:multidrug resistance efflux pump|uniref:Secretion protein HlyD n=1 Tax=Flagellimonas aquimarina TaxID=2201895 RepID=A0A316L173_9FLAO|nr:HlyD family efflux transporter periplasmic adaptor subunit [Allomuricauda koreensis]PWL40242.1 secretion protein HlyD [Allomuricauda koreensis]